MDNLNRQYESTVIINASLEEDKIEQIIAKIERTLTEQGAEIASVERIGRKRLAYPIGKKTNGFYTRLEFTAAAPVIAELERIYRLDEDVVRYLTVLLDKKALAYKQVVADRQAAGEPIETEPEPRREGGRDGDRGGRSGGSREGGAPRGDRSESAR